MNYTCMLLCPPDPQSSRVWKKPRMSYYEFEPITQQICSILDAMKFKIASIIVIGGKAYNLVRK